MRLLSSTAGLGMVIPSFLYAFKVYVEIDRKASLHVGDAFRPARG
jgi:hypothetical protein